MTRFGSLTRYAWSLVVSRLKASTTLAVSFLEASTLSADHRAEAQELLRQSHDLNAKWHALARRIEADACQLRNEMEAAAEGRVEHRKQEEFHMEAA